MQLRVQDDAQITILPGDAADADAAFESVCRENPELRIEQKSSGEIIVLSPAGNESSDRNREIIGQLHNWTVKDGRGRAFDSNTVFRLPDGSKMGPDAAWVSKEKILAFPKQERKRFLPVVPDFIIELRSPTDDLSVLEAKMQDWVRNGVQIGWLIDADARMVWVYAPGGVREQLNAPASVRGTGAVAGFELVLAEIYRGLDF